MTKYNKKVLIVYGSIIFMILLFLACWNFVWAVKDKSPAFHIRNEKYMIGVYYIAGGGVGTEASMSVTMVDLDSYFKYEKEIMFIESQPNARVKNVYFTDTSKISVVIYRHYKRDSVIVNLDLEDLPSKRRYYY